KPEDEVMIITDRGQTIRTPIEGIRETGRNAQGVKLMSIGDDERVVAIEPIGESRDGAALEGDDGAEDNGGHEPGDGEQEPGESMPPPADSLPPASNTEDPGNGGQEES
ncbi:MAG TPA: DNA gyrase C-terminal beta-propeller domain-containing protein, partial [Polyangiaceae bacterium]